MDDADALVRRWCRTGDEAAFDRFYEHEAPAVWRVLVVRGADEDTAYDLVAEAFARFIDRVCADPRAPRALLYRIAINLATDRFRRQRVRAPAATEPDALAGGDPPVELSQEARRLLASLQPGERDLLLMRYWIQLTHREIAEVLDVPEGTVRRRAAALLHRLRDELDAT